MKKTISILMGSIICITAFGQYRPSDSRNNVDYIYKAPIKELDELINQTNSYNKQLSNYLENVQNVLNSITAIKGQEFVYISYLQEYNKYIDNIIYEIYHYPFNHTYAGKLIRQFKSDMSNEIYSKLQSILSADDRQRIIESIFKRIDY